MYSENFLKTLQTSLKGNFNGTWALVHSRHWDTQRVLEHSGTQVFEPLGTLQHFKEMTRYRFYRVFKNFSEYITQGTRGTLFNKLFIFWF